MKRYWVFAFERYYPAGGMNDLVDQTDSRVEAIKIAAMKEGEGSYIQIEDTLTNKTYSTVESAIEGMS